MPKTSPKTQHRQKIVIGINSLANSPYAAYSNHIQVFYSLGRRYPNIDFCIVNPCRMSIDKMRQLAADTALDIEASHLLFIDDDILLPAPHTFLRKLLDCDADIACGDVLIRSYPFKHMIFRKHPTDPDGLYLLENVPKKLGPIPVDAVGFSLALIKTDLLHKVPRPWFVTGVNNTEDVYFCFKARDKFPECKIICDTSIQCGHILGSEMIEPANKKAYSKYWETMFGKPKETEDRGNDYYRIVRGQ